MLQQLADLVCASAMALLRVPIRIRIVTTDAPIGAAGIAAHPGSEHKTSLWPNAKRISGTPLASDGSKSLTFQVIDRTCAQAQCWLRSVRAGRVKRGKAMQRRELLRTGAVVSMGLVAAGGGSPSEAKAASPKPDVRHPKTIQARDGTTLFYRDWGQGKPILFVAAWGLDSQAWQYQMIRLSDEGFRCIAFDRRGHGRSSDPGAGYEIDNLADDVASVVEQLDLSDFVLVGHSLGAAESVRYLTRHGSNKVRRLVLVAPTTPFLIKTDSNPDGIDPNVFQAARSAFRKDFPGILAANSKPFVVPTTSQAMIDWIMQMMTRTSLKALVESHAAFTVADFRQELPKLTLPTLILQGDADASAPLLLTGRKTAALLPNAELKVYEGAPHGLIFTHSDRLNEDLLMFAKG